MVALAVGYPMGLWLASVSRGRKLLTGLLLVPFVLPAFLIGLSVRPVLATALDDPRVGIMAVIAAHAVMNAGFLAVVTAASQVPLEQRHAASLDGASPRQVRWLVEFPQQLPALSAAGLLVALYSATSFGLIVTLGQGSINTLETGIAVAALQQLDLRHAGLLAVLQSVLTLGFFALSTRLGANPTVLFGGGHTRATRYWPGLGVTIVVAAVIVWLIAGVVVRAVTSGPGLWTNVTNLSGRGSRDLLNLTVVEAAGNSLRTLAIAVVLSLVVAWWLAGKRVGLAVLIPVGISPVVLGLGALVLSGYLPASFAASWLLLPLVHSVFLIPLAFQIVAPARRSMSPELLDAARIDGARGSQILRLIELPLLRRPVTAAAALVGLGSLGEFGAARFLTYGSDQTLPLVMFRLMARPGGDNLGMAMVAASGYIVLAIAVVWVISSAGATRDRGVHSG